MGGQARGRGRRRLQPTTRNSSRIRVDPAEGLTIRSTDCPRICIEQEFTDELISERSFLSNSSAAHRIGLELSARKLPYPRVGITSLFLSEILWKCMCWINEKIVLQSLGASFATIADMYRFVAIALLSHCTGFSLKKRTEWLHGLGCSISSLERVRFITAPLMEHAPTGIGSVFLSVWSAQRDGTPLICGFEMTAFVCQENLSSHSLIICHIR